MIWYLLIGMFLTGWTLLLLVSSERARRLQVIENKRQQALIEARKRLERANEIPVIS